MTDTTELYHRIKAWQKTGKPPQLAFTEGLERVVATLVWEAELKALDYGFVCGRSKMSWKQAQKYYYDKQEGVKP